MKPSPLPNLSKYVGALLVSASLLLPGTVLAESTVRLQLQAVDSGGDLGLGGEDFGSSLGFYAGFEKRINQRLGVEVGIAWTEFEQDFRQDLIFVTVDVSTSLRMIPVTVALDIHLTPDARHDFYVAPKIGYAFFDDLELSTRVDFGDFPFPFPSDLPGGVILSDFEIDELPSMDFGVEDQFLYGLRIGYDVPFGDAWTLSTSIDYTVVDLELENPEASGSTGLDPLSIGVGASFRF